MRRGALACVLARAEEALDERSLPLGVQQPNECARLHVLQRSGFVCAALAKARLPEWTFVKRG